MPPHPVISDILSGFVLMRVPYDDGMTGANDIKIRSMSNANCLSPIDRICNLM